MGQTADRQVVHPHQPHPVLDKPCRAVRHDCDEVLVENGQPVEYGQRLFKIKQA